MAGAGKPPTGASSGPTPGRPTTVTAGNVVIRRTPQPNTTARITGGIYVPPGWVNLACSDPPMIFTARLGPEPWVPTAGWGGYDIVDRPLQVGMTIIKGVPPWAVAGSVIFDGLKDMMSQEDDIKRLMSVAHGDDQSQPGLISVKGVPNLPADDWFIEDMEFDADSVIRHPLTMERVRQKVTFTLREYVSPDYIRSAKNAFQRPKGKVTIITVKDKDTPHKVAVRYHCRVRDLRQLNPNNKYMLKSNTKLPHGMRLRVPVKDNKKHADRKSSSRGNRG